MWSPLLEAVDFEACAVNSFATLGTWFVWVPCHMARFRRVGSRAMGPVEAGRRVESAWLHVKSFLIRANVGAVVLDTRFVTPCAWPCALYMRVSPSLSLSCWLCSVLASSILHILWLLSYRPSTKRHIHTLREHHDDVTHNLGTVHSDDGFAMSLEQIIWK
ncbi:hypothetical protein G7046_g6490 [Stylonectria norvegica]|nr:hypothetical protein G7046_g6490 [Stylonectria norvegica]